MICFIHMINFLYTPTYPLSSTPFHSHLLPPTSIHSHPLPPIPVYSYALLSNDSFAADCHLFPLFSAHSCSFLGHSYSLSLMFSPLLANLSPLPPIIQPLLSTFSPHPNILTQSNPSPTTQPIFSPCVLRAYVLYVPVRLCAFVFHVPTCLRNSFLCTLLPMSI